MGVAVVELAAGDAAVDDVAHVLVDLGLLLTDVGDLFLGEPLGDVGPLLEVHRRPLEVAGDADQQPAGEVVDRLAGRRRRVVVQRGHGEVGGALVDVVEDQRLAGVVVVHRRLVQPDRVGHVVHPGAVVAPRGEQLGGDGQQLLAAGHPVRALSLSLFAQAAHRKTWRLTIGRPGLHPGHQSTGWTVYVLRVLPPLAAGLDFCVGTADTREGEHMDPNPDYDASDEVEYGANWFALDPPRRVPTARLSPGLTDRTADSPVYHVGPVKNPSKRMRCSTQHFQFTVRGQRLEPSIPSTSVPVPPAPDSVSVASSAPPDGVGG